MSRAPVRAKQAVCRGFPSLRPPVFPGGCPTGTEPGLKLPCFLELTSWCVGTLPLANQSVTTGSPTPVGRTLSEKGPEIFPCFSSSENPGTTSRRAEFKVTVQGKEAGASGAFTLGIQHNLAGSFACS